MIVSELVATLFPHLTGLRVDAVARSGASVRIHARTGTPRAVCPGCGTLSGQVHSRYERRLSDLATGGQETVIHLQVARFLCRNDQCGKKTFAEQVPGLTIRHGRHSLALREVLRAVALALGGRAGARLTSRLAAAVGRMTLIRMLRALPDPTTSGGPRVLGVDDFALRRGHRYGTILIDMDTGRPIDMLPERSSQALATWLSEHPGVQIVCRDRAGCYADGVARGAPEAIQVADRWHMWKNLGDAVERTVAKHRAYLQELVHIGHTDNPPAATALPAAPPPAAEADPAQRTGRLAERTRQRHAAVHHLLAQGKNLRAIAAELGLSRNTVRRFARATDAGQLLVADGTGRRPKALDHFAEYLRDRWNQGCTNAQDLYQEIKARGYLGGATAVRQYVSPWRSSAPTGSPVPVPPTVRQATGWLLRNPTSLDADEQRQLDALTTACPPLAAVREHVSAFAEMMTHRRGHQLDRWMTGVDADDLPELRSFVAGLRRDYDAARAGLSLPHSSGPVEGHVNRIKMIKRQMYGRANPDILRKRILLAD